MSRKIPVAFVCTAKLDGERTYTAFAKSGEKLKAWTAGDHGHGAHLCQQACLAAGYEPSGAVWTEALFRRHGYQFAHQDKTEYCRGLGYTGTKPVTVCDGRVTSHGNVDWFDFCHALQPQPETKEAHHAH